MSPPVYWQQTAIRGLESKDWANDRVRSLFTQSGYNNNGTRGSDNGNNSSDSREGSSNETPVGAIAGGVVGGLAGIAIVGAAAWFLLRRHRQSQEELVGGLALEQEKSSHPRQCMGQRLRMRVSCTVIKRHRARRSTYLSSSSSPVGYDNPWASV